MITNEYITIVSTIRLNRTIAVDRTEFLSFLGGGVNRNIQSHICITHTRFSFIIMDNNNSHDDNKTTTLIDIAYIGPTGVQFIEADLRCLVASSQYFKALVGGSWRESATRCLEIEGNYATKSVETFFGILNLEATPTFDTLGDLVHLADRFMTSSCVMTQVDRWLVEQFENRTEEAIAVMEDPEAFGSVLEIAIQQKICHVLCKIPALIAKEVQLSNIIPFRVIHELETCNTCTALVKRETYLHILAMRTKEGKK